MTEPQTQVGLRSFRQALRRRCGPRAKVQTIATKFTDTLPHSQSSRRPLCFNIHSMYCVSAMSSRKGLSRPASRGVLRHRRHPRARCGAGARPPMVARCDVTPHTEGIIHQKILRGDLPNDGSSRLLEFEPPNLGQAKSEKQFVSVRRSFAASEAPRLRPGPRRRRPRRRRGRGRLEGDADADRRQEAG